MYAIEISNPHIANGRWFPIYHAEDAGDVAEYLKTLTDGEKRSDVKYRMYYVRPLTANLQSP